MERATSLNAPEYEIINLGRSETTQLKDLIAGIGEAVDIESEIGRLPMQASNVERTYAAISKTHRLLGYDPSTPIEEGLQKVGEWVKDYYAEWKVPAP